MAGTFRSAAILLTVILALTAGQSSDAARASLGVSSSKEKDEATLMVPTVTYADLTDPAAFEASTADDVLRRAMLDDGILSVSGVPGFAQLRREVMLGAARCGPHAPAARTTMFGDGTARRTFASLTKGFDASEAIDFIGDRKGNGDTEVDAAIFSSSCSDQFKAKTDEFRAVVSAVTEQFTKRLSEVFPTQDGQPLLWDMSHTKSFATVEEVARAAEHLEHFHAYHRPAAAAPAAAEAEADAAEGATESSTIDLHADLGLFIAFTPGLIVQTSVGSDAEEVITADGTSAPAGIFYVERRDGSRARAEFGFNGDVIVLMLGDGVDSIVNSKMPRGMELRAAPHGMVMPSGLTPSQARMWYGRMFLPPAEAVSERHGLTYGDLRKKVIEEVHSGGGVGGGVGCSRQLLETDGTQCADNQIYCWHRCMEVSPDTCAAKGNLKLQCTTQRDEIWGGIAHGDFNPACSNTTANQTSDPSMPDNYTAPSDCAGTFADFLNKTSYPNSHELVKDKLYLQWRLSEGGVVEARMAYDGVVGWLAIGASNPGGGHNGMNGAHIVMGVYDPDPNLYGGAAWLNYVGTGVKERVIHHKLSAFRHWKEPYTPAGLVDSAMEVTRCHSHMTFKTASMAGVALNTTKGSSNELIWAVHTDGLLKNYHGFGNRGHLKVDFSAVAGHLARVNPYATTAPPSPSEVSSASKVTSNAIFAVFAGVAAVCLLVL